MTIFKPHVAHLFQIPLSNESHLEKNLKTQSQKNACICAIILRQQHAIKL